VEGTNLRLWQPVSFDSGMASTPLSGDKIVGVTVNDPFSGVVLLGGSYHLSGYAPPGRFLTDNGQNIDWRNNVNLGDIVFAYQIYNTIFVKENIMSYATGKSDFKDSKTYLGQAVANWPYAPNKHQPVKMVNGDLIPAQSTDEVIYAIVIDSQAVQTDVGGVMTTTSYTIEVLIAEAELEDSALSFNNSETGQPLYVQDYSNVATPTFNDIYSVNPPTSGFTHPLFIVTSATSIHYNGTVRPDIID
jgi:hypothetical protein